MTKNTSESTSLDDRIAAIEQHIENAGGLVGEDTPLLITLSSTLAQLYQAKAQIAIAEQTEEIAAFLSGIVELVSGPVGEKIFEMMGLDDSDDDNDSDNDFDDDMEDEDDMDDEDEEDAVHVVGALDIDPDRN